MDEELSQGNCLLVLRSRIPAGMAAVPTNGLHPGAELLAGETTLSRLDRNSDPDLPVIRRPVEHESDALDRSDTEADWAGQMAHLSPSRCASDVGYYEVFADICRTREEKQEWGRRHIQVRVLGIVCDKEQSVHASIELGHIEGANSLHTGARMDVMSLPLPSHYVDTSAILWDFLWGVKHQPPKPWIPADFVYLCVTGACAVALLASVGRPRVVVKLLTTLATLGVKNLLRVTTNYLHRMKALLPHSYNKACQKIKKFGCDGKRVPEIAEPDEPTPSFLTKLAYPLGKAPMKLAKKNDIQKLLPYVPHEHREFNDAVVEWPIIQVVNRPDTVVTLSVKCDGARTVSCHCDWLANALVVLSPTAEDGDIEVRISVGVEEPLQTPAPSCRRRRSEWMTQSAECEDDGAEEETPPPSDEPLADHSKRVTRRNRTSLSRTNIEARDISAE
ncbi:unnamed protein product [Timema podura]|uniref:Uncharacterized protein n=1 Tax=Timema podura TaxID=61482 RepID=A0ABN7NI43_TIMPD|nr:unnamed protein product [Timema podura]